MDDNEKCVIRRLAVFLRYEAEFAVIEVEGKEIRIPADKIGPDAVPGGTLAWTRGLWRPAD
ncbi:hypothetical protein ACFOLF_03840 [Paenibacillus sepulcri]|uniref:hypothetical protein n=1 Tax=Paenibacillus sepulcri TaxID=359917 RepID=UPI001AE4C0EE